MRNVPWTPAFEVASSLQGRLDHAIIEPGKQVTGKQVTVTLSPSDGEASAGAARAAFVKALPVHIEALSDAVARLRNRLAKAGRKNGSAFPTAEYALALYERADADDVNPARYNLRDEFAAANAILDALDEGRDPFAARRGDFRKAYRSAVDNTLQPYGHRRRVPRIPECA